MAGLLVPFQRLSPRLEVPNGRLTIDWSHPLSNGLIGCWVPGAMGGIDLTGNCADLSYVGTPALASGIGPEGPNLYVPATPVYHGLGGPAPAKYNGLATASFYTRGQKVGSNGAQAYPFMLSYDNGLNSPYFQHTLQVSSATNAVAAGFTNTGGSLQQSASLDYSSGTDLRVGYVKGLFGGNGFIRMFNRGQLIDASANTLSGSAPSSTATSRVSINVWEADSARVSGTAQSIVYFWNRALSDAEMALVDADPYAILVPAYQESLPAIATTAGGTTQHLAANAAAVSTGTAELAGPITVAARWNSSDATANAVITNGGLTLGGSSTTAYARSNQYESSGKKYFEHAFTGSNRPIVGLANASETLGNSPGSTVNSVAYYSLTGAIKLNNVTLDTVATSAATDILGVYVDLDARLVWFTKNGVALSGSPGVSGGYSIPTGPLAILGYNISSSTTTNINATTTYTPQPGFTGFGNGIATNQHLAATAAVVATGTAETRVKYHLAATAASVASATADVRRSFHIIASAAALSTATANLDVQAGGTDHLAANATSVKTATAALRVTHHLAAGAAATCSASAFLVAGAIDIFANARVVVSGSGTLSKFWTDISDAPEIWTDIR